MANFCGYRWYGPRADQSGAYANHICALPDNHPTDVAHRCTCKAWALINMQRWADGLDAAREEIAFRRGG